MLTALIIVGIVVGVVVLTGVIYFLYQLYEGKKMLKDLYEEGFYD